MLKIPDETLNKENSVLQNPFDAESTKNEFNTFLQLLGLTEKYPKKLQVKDAMLIREETLDNIKHTNQVKLLPYLILQKIFMFDSRSRAALFKDTDKSSRIRKIHPIDGFLTLLHCCDNFLCQELLLKVSVCQMAIPLLLPNPCEGNVIFLLWAMRLIIKSWKSNNNGVITSKECRIIEYPAPVISFLKFGKQKKSKSNIINEVISESKEDFFFNWNSEGGTSKNLFVDGLCEICCYLPSGKNNASDFYSDMLLFLNLRGDAQKHEKQTKFTNDISYMVFVLVNEDDINESSLKLLTNLSKVPGGVTLIFPELEDDQPFESKETEQFLSGISDNGVSVIKLAGKNGAEIRNEIRDNILAKLKLPSVKQCKKLCACTEIARKLNILVDEDNEECKEGKLLAQNLMKKVKSLDITKAKAKLLPLQGSSLWHTWAKLDKESYRQISREDTDMKTYSKQMEVQKKEIRRTQGQLSETSLFMKDFVANISVKGNIRLYFLQWLKMFLDDHSRKELPDLSAGYHKTRADLLKANEASKDCQNESEEVKKLKQQLKDQNDKLINASFGLEHLFREMGQIFEAIMDPQLQVSQHLKDEVNLYPQIIVELMEEGYPVELMDGDASHVPKSWVLAVIKKLKKKYDQRSKIFVISVLGIQSTGKSTLLNTVFGLHFNVSAGRCTRGAYFQLLPLNDALRVQSNFHHILIVDTEGLRAPELQYKESLKHDNELATFVIGLADLTIINIYGETPGDLTDILETAVHAFIRMKQVNMHPSCHFVHQNVPAVMADKKGKFGRQQFQDKLDLMTKTAAEGENLGGEYRYFHDVIHFDSETDVMFFPSLWKGDPPMAPVNQGYSDNAYILKKALITLTKKMKEQCTFDKFQVRVSKLWEAVLREKFVFSFKNTLEVIAYNELDTQYSQWSWTLKRKMLQWQNESTNIITSCEPSKLKECTENSLKKAKDDLDITYLELNTKMKTFFETSEKADTLAQWRKRYETRLQTILEEHKEAAKKHCEIVKCSREGRVKLDEIRKDYRQQLHEIITTIALDAKKEKYTPQQRKEVFNEQWQKWLNGVSEFENAGLYASETYIYTTIDKILENTFATHGHLIIAKLKSGPLSYRGHNLHLPIVDSVHLSPNKTKLGKVVNAVVSVFSQSDHITEEDLQDAKFKTQQYLHAARERIEEAVCKLQDYDPNVVDEILMNLLCDIDEQNGKKSSFKFTLEYRVDICIVAAGYAAKEMIKMVNKLRIQNSPIQSLNKLKPIFFRTFESKFSAASNDKTAADNLSQLLSMSIQTSLIKVLRIEVVTDMKTKVHFQKKNYFKAKILEDLAKRGDFNLFTTFLSDITSSFQYWAKIYIEDHCKEIKNHESRLTNLVKIHLSTIINNLTEAVNVLESKYADISENNNTTTDVATSDITDLSTNSEDEYDDTDDEDGICIDLWLDDFLQQTKKVIMIDLQEVQEMIGIKKLKHIKLFTKRFVNNLKKLEEGIIMESKNKYSKLAKVSEWDPPPYMLLSSTLTGCKETCPFCREQCEYTDDKHDENAHFTDMHRPRCLGKRTWNDSNLLVLDICSETIESETISFRDSKTNNEWVLYKQYKTIYPEWVISNEQPKDGQTYWQWFCAKYNSQIVKWVGSNPTPVERGWKSITREDAIRSLKLTYGAKVDT